MKKTIAFLIFICLAAMSVFSGCAPTQYAPIVSTDALENFEAPDYGVTYYDNYQYNAYYNPEEAQKHLPDQGVYGSGNAFILRYNGRYYMYMGSSNFASSSLPCWVSEDLMVWEKVDNGRNTVGFIAEDPRLAFAYPPCVRQYNNRFYMYLYIKNDVIEQGNYILVADSPIGPFEFVTDDGGELLCYTIAATATNIDADIFIDDNEDVYFMSAHQDNYFTGIRAFKMPTMDRVAYDDDNYINIAESSVGGWTEGNGFFKRNGNYYLMYTGSNILSPGYLTHYSTAIGDGWKNAFGTEDRVNAQGFEQGIDWPMGCETDPEFYSLGHATSVLGPDMDGLYYHYFSVNSSGPNCTFAIDRLIFNGTGMDAAQTQYRSVTPKRPQIYSYDPLGDSRFTASDGRLLSNDSTNTVFTAEFNFVGDTESVFAYRDENNYWSVGVDIAAKKVCLFETVNGVKSERATGSIVRAYDAPNLLKTVRVAYADGLLDVYFDDLLKIENFAATVSAGKFGYMYASESNVSFGYTAASAVAKGLSDKVEPKLSYINIGAESYLPQGVYDGHGSVLRQGSGYAVVDADEYNGAHIGLGKMCLTNAGDTATYLVDFKTGRTGGGSGYYALHMTMNKQNGGKQIGVRVDGGQMFVVTLPQVDPTNGEALIKTYVTDIPVAAGVHQISFTCLGDGVEFHSFTFTESSSEKFSYEQSLESAPANGMEQRTLWRFQKQDGDEKASLVSREGARSLVYFGGKSLVNYTVECDFRINTDSAYTAGFIIGGNRYSDSAYVTEDYRYIQGYYVSFTKRAAKIEKLNYTHTDSNAAAERVSLEIGAWNHVKITVQGSTLSVEIVGGGRNTTLTFTDSIAFGGGRFGFYSSGASASYRNLRITG
ncbi:MAG: family 43 glycosylhydrolase [Clostridia bacterium]|nr:family 43 glycosylhydrolase [Clostridia bacterium]